MYITTLKAINLTHTFCCKNFYKYPICVGYLILLIIIKFGMQRTFKQINSICEKQWIKWCLIIIIESIYPDIDIWLRWLAHMQYQLYSGNKSFNKRPLSLFSTSPLINRKFLMMRISRTNPIVRKTPFSNF